MATLTGMRENARYVYTLTNNTAIKLQKTPPTAYSLASIIALYPSQPFPSACVLFKMQLLSLKYDNNSNSYLKTMTMRKKLCKIISIQNTFMAQHHSQVQWSVP